MENEKRAEFPQTVISTEKDRFNVFTQYDSRRFFTAYAMDFIRLNAINLLVEGIGKKGMERKEFNKHIVDMVLIFGKAAKDIFLRTLEDLMKDPVTGLEVERILLDIVSTAGREGSGPLSSPTDPPGGGASPDGGKSC